MAKSPTRQVAAQPVEEEKVENLPVASAAGSNLPAFLQEDAAEFGGAGTSNRQEDLTLPYLQIIQKTSPQVNRRDPDFIEGVEPGDILNTATRHVYKTSQDGTTLDVIHAYMQRNEVEWILRTAGGGYVMTHGPDTPLLREVKEVAKPQGKGVTRMLPNGHQLVSTAYHFVVPVETLDIAVIALTSTGLQVSRRWNTLMRSYKTRGPNGPVIMPSFSRRYRLRTVYNTNEAGDWFSFGVDDISWVDEECMSAYQVAKEFFVNAMAHGVQMGRPPVSESTEDGGPIINNDDAPI